MRNSEWADLEPHQKLFCTLPLKPSRLLRNYVPLGWFFFFFFYPFKFLLNVVQGFGLIGLDLNLNMHNVNIASNRTWVLLNVRHAPHQDFCLCSWQTRIASPDTSHAHTRPSAASLSMNPASRHWFTNPCCSSRRGQPRKGLCLFVLRETWWKNLWFICSASEPQERIRKQMDKSYLVSGCDGVWAFLLAWPVS